MACARAVAAAGGHFPDSEEDLRALPGVGDYTAGAIASIAFGLPVPAVDGNVLRVFARLYNDDADVMTPAAKKGIQAIWMAQMVIPAKPNNTKSMSNMRMMP